MSNEHIAERIAASAQKPRARIAVAESLTSGALASALGAAPDAAEWFAGGIVAYNSDVKHNLLRVSPGPVVRAGAAEVVARAARGRVLWSIAGHGQGAVGPGAPV